MIEQHVVKVLDGGGVKIKQFDAGLHRLGDGRKENQAQTLFAGQGNDFDFGAGDGGQRAFAATEQMDQVSGFARATIKAVAGTVFQQAGRHVFGNLERVKINQVGNEFALLWKRVATRANGHEVAVGQHNFKLANVRGCRAVVRCVRAAGIVRDHSTQRRTRTSSNVRAKSETMGTKEVVQLIKDDARTDAHGAFFQVEVRDLAIVAGEIYDEAFPNGAACQSGARATGNHRYARLERGLNQGAGLLCAPRKTDGDRFDLIHGRVRGVKLPGQVVECDVAIRTCERRVLLCGGHR